MRASAKFLYFSLIIGSLFSQSDLESSVLGRIQEMMRANSGRVTFSDLHNDSRFSKDEKAFLERLYEIFFEIPSYLRSRLEDSERIPAKQEIASHFEISPNSVELLLRVMESDRRIPPLFRRDSATGEISELNGPNIDAFVQNRGSGVRLTRWEGRSIPAFELTDLDGETWSSSSLEGRNSLLYFWFTGCPPCVRIAPILAELEKEYRDDGFQFLGMNADDILGITLGEDQRKEYLAKSGTEYPNLHLDARTREAFGNVNVYPTLFFVDKSGTVVEHLLNFQDRDVLEQIIRRMLSD